MNTVTLFERDEAGRERQAVRFIPAGLIVSAADVTLLERPGAGQPGRWQQLPQLARQAVRQGLGLVVRAARRAPRGWDRGLPEEAIVAWLSGNGRRGWQGELCRNGETEAVHEVVVAETGVRHAVAEEAIQHPVPLAEAVWEPIRGGVGPAFQRFRTDWFTIIGQGRAGSEVDRILASTGATHLALCDPDSIEPRNRTGLLGTQVRPHEQKVAALGRILREHFAGITVREVACSSAQRPMVEVLTNQPSTVLITAADSEAARFVGACYAATLSLAHLDVGIGVREEEGRVVRGGQVVFVPPGQGCLLCVRDLRWLEVERDLAGDAVVQLEARQAGQRRDDTLGTVPDLLSRVASTGIGLVRRWLGEEADEPQRLFLHDDGLAEQLPRARARQECPICALASCGQAFLQGIFPPPAAEPMASADSPQAMETDMGPSIAESNQDIGAILMLLGAATVDLLQGQTEGLALRELATRLVAAGLTMDLPAPLGPVLEQMVPQGVGRRLSMVGASPDAELWVVEGTGANPATVVFPPERRWLPIARQIQQQLATWRRTFAP